MAMHESFADGWWKLCSGNNSVCGLLLWPARAFGTFVTYEGLHVRSILETPRRQIWWLELTSMRGKGPGSSLLLQLRAWMGCPIKSCKIHSWLKAYPWGKNSYLSHQLQSASIVAIPTILKHKIFCMVRIVLFKSSDSLGSCASLQFVSCGVNGSDHSWSEDCCRCYSCPTVLQGQCSTVELL